MQTLLRVGALLIDCWALVSAAPFQHGELRKQKTRYSIPAIETTYDIQPSQCYGSLFNRPISDYSPQAPSTVNSESLTVLRRSQAKGMPFRYPHNHSIVWDATLQVSFPDSPTIPRNEPAAAARLASRSSTMAALRTRHLATKFN